MARSHGVLFTSIWDDDDFIALPALAQRIYALLISQKKLTLIGLLDYLPSRWARLAPDTTIDDIDRGVTQLATSPSRFVIVDHDTDELLIRTLVKHDVVRTLTNSNIIKGLWRAWDSIESRQLRLEAVRAIPDQIWTSRLCQPHTDALQIRRSIQSEPTVQTGGSDQPSEPPERTSLLPPPSTLHPPPDTPSADPKQPVHSRGPATPEAAANPILEAVTTDQRQQRIADAVEILVTREIQRNPTRNGNPTRHANAVRKGKLTDHHQAGHELLVNEPSLTPATLADILEPPPLAPAAGQRRPEPARATPDGQPFIPGIGIAPGPALLGDEPDQHTHQALLTNARSALPQCHPEAS